MELIRWVVYFALNLWVKPSTRNLKRVEPFGETFNAKFKMLNAKIKTR
jgi:hypothetical protein